MKKTLTIFLSVCLALVLAYGGVSYWVGVQAREFHDRGIARINSSGYLKASVKSYERGLFRSRDLTMITLTRPEKGDSIRFGVIDTVYHGPFVFIKDPHFKESLKPVMAVIRTRLAPGDSSGELKKVLEKFPELKSSEVLTVLSMDGSAKSYFDVPSFRKKFPDDKGGKVEVDWGGLTAKSTFDARLGKVTGHYDSPSLQITTKDQMLRIKDVHGDFDSHPGIKGISVGSAAFSIGDIENIRKGNTAFTLNSLDLKAQSGVHEGTVNGSLRLGFDKLNTGGLRLGPLAMEFQARKLDAGVLARFQKLSRVLRQEGSEKTEAFRQEMKSLCTRMMIDLLAKSPEFEIKQFNLRTNKGDLSGKARLVFDDHGKDLSRNILALFASIDASAKLSVSQALFYFVAENAFRKGSAPDADSAKASAGGLVTRLLAAKYMVAEAGAFKSSASFKHGSLTVNGRKLSLSNLP